MIVIHKIYNYIVCVHLNINVTLYCTITCVLECVCAGFQGFISNVLVEGKCIFFKITVIHVVEGGGGCLRESPRNLYYM